ncbi:inositol monophosphatase family protein [Pseudalkalibacillus sp. SCS-8]|uniref:inositol monophosphatase family protein n=1 Tax=Pseudalkalibacillus nanhaiensis TaxID=3115291 RepID=UPI0032DA8124
MEKTLSKATRLAETVIREAGSIAKENFDRILEFNFKDENGDIVTEIDIKIEKFITERIAESFPDHTIQGEESGSNGVDSDWIWQIDPLDGTNNFVIGLPIFSSSITLIYKHEPVLGVIYEPMVDRLYLTIKNEGSFCNGKKMHLKESNNKNLNIGWIQGHHVKNEQAAVSLRQHIDLNCKRMMRLWAPTLHWTMLAKGEIDGIVLYNSVGEDLYSGLLMVKEAGYLVTDFEGNEFTGMSDEPYLIACHPNNKETFLSLVHEGLKSYAR